MKAPSSFPSMSIAAIIAVFALSSCTKERAQDLAPLSAMPEQAMPEQIMPPTGQQDAFDLAKQASPAFGSATLEQSARVGKDAGSSLPENHPRLIQPAQQADAGRIGGSDERTIAGQAHMGREEVIIRPEVEFLPASRPYEHPQP